MKTCGIKFKKKNFTGGGTAFTAHQWQIPKSTPNETHTCSFTFTFTISVGLTLAFIFVFTLIIIIFS